MLCQRACHLALAVLSADVDLLSWRASIMVLPQIEQSTCIVGWRVSSAAARACAWQCHRACKGVLHSWFVVLSLWQCMHIELHVQVCAHEGPHFIIKASTLLINHCTAMCPPTWLLPTSH